MLACVTCSMNPWFSKNRCQNLGNGAAKKKHFLSNYWFMIFRNKIIRLDTHSTRNSSLNFHQAGPILFYSRLTTFPPRITQNNAEGSWWSGCPKCRKLLHVEKFHTHLEFNSSLIFMRETYELLAREYANRAKWPTGNSERPVHNFPGNQILAFFRGEIGDQEQAQTMADHFTANAVFTRKTRCHLVAFHE